MEVVYHLQKKENCRQYVDDHRSDITLAQTLPEELEASGGTCWIKSDE